MELVDAGMARSHIAGDPSKLMKIARNIAVVVSVLGALIVAGCTATIQPREIPAPRDPEPTPAPRSLDLPADDASHRAPIEWWYYNGHLASENGAEYSFHFVIFQTENDDGSSTFEVGQAGITDVDSKEHIGLISESIASQNVLNDEATDSLLDLDLENFALRIASDGSHSLAASDSSDGTKLSLRTSKPTATMLHQGIGWMDWPFGWTYYYSYPRMQAEGTITLNGQENTVTGEIWFDHQWGDFFVIGKPAGWQWFALQLDDGRSLMVSEVRGAEGQVLAVDGTLVASDSNHQVLEAETDGITIDVLDYWTSPETGGEYPASWRLRIESLDFDVTMTPTVADQEVPALPYANQAAAYWEGRVDVRETSNGKSIGLAFVELSGYVDPQPLVWQNDTR